MVRAIKLETSGSGTYFNLSQGAFVTPATIQLPPALATIEKPKDPETKIEQSTQTNPGHNAVEIRTQ
jgi:hypothetical protein